MRLPDWKERLYAAIDEARDRPAAYGVHDCLKFPAMCIEAITGVDPAAQFGEYKSELGAARLMIEYGGVSGILTHAFGESVAPNLARSGDVIVTADPAGREFGGICNGTTCAFVMVPRGLVFAPRNCIAKAWLID